MSCIVPAEFLSLMHDEAWAETLCTLVVTHDRVWVGDHGAYVERELVDDRLPCLTFGSREEDGVDAILMSCPLSSFVGEEVRARRRRFATYLTDLSRGVGAAGGNGSGPWFRPEAPPIRIEAQDLAGFVAANDRERARSLNGLLVGDADEHSGGVER